jgi:hypothetical protein
LELVDARFSFIFQGFPRHTLYRSLGLCLVVATPDPSIHMQLVNQVWKGVAKLPTIENYVTCAEVWIQFILKHFSVSFTDASCMTVPRLPITSWRQSF